MKSIRILIISLILSLAALWRATAQPTIVSTVPANGATGVSPTAPVVFTFSEPMDESSVSANFYTSFPVPPFVIFYNVGLSWNATSDVLTCTPSSSFLSNTQVFWSVSGDSASASGSVNDSGWFFTGGSGSTGYGTNAYTTFVVGKTTLYNQTSTNQPVLDSFAPYAFNGITSLASNRTANSNTLTLPTSAVSNLTQNPFRQEVWNLSAYYTNSTAFDATFPSGNYTFNVYATASNQTVTVNLPASMGQPNAPHLTNWPAAQAVDASQPFTLRWDPFTGGALTDYIFAVVGANWQTPGFGMSGALNGTSNSVTIPAGTLAAGTTNSASLGFYHAIIVTNGNYVTEVYRASVTQFELITSPGAIKPVLTNAAWSGGSFNFDVLTSAGQTVTVVYGTNLNLVSTNWPVLLTTNSPGGKFHVSDPHSTTNKTLFYRARNGS